MNLLFVCSLFAFAGVAILAGALSKALSAVAGRLVRRCCLLVTVAASLGVLAFAAYVGIRGETARFFFYSLGGSMDFSFAVDRLSAFFLAIISFVSAAVSIYSLTYAERHGSNAAKNVLVAVMSLFVLSMLLVVAADNMFAFLFFWETMSLSSFLLVMFDRDKADTGKSGLFYFVMTQMSTTFLMLAFLALYALSGSLRIGPAGSMSGLLKAGVFLSLFVGFGIKAGVMPFHKWLPYAHSASPSNVSALMSGVMIKVAIYGLARFLLFVLSPDGWWGIAILSFGVFSALLGVIYALKEHDIKKLLAYHSIENIGIILMGFGLYLIFTFYELPGLALLSLVGGLFHTLNHALFKSLLFLTAGSVVEATGTRNIEEMGGLIKVMPWTGALFLIGSVSIAALPPFNGFVSELMIFQAFLQAYLIENPFVRVLLFVGLSLFALTSALAAACFVKAFGIIFLATPRSHEAAKAHELSPAVIVGPALLAAACAALGVFSYQILGALGYVLPIPDMMAMGLSLLGVSLLVWLVTRLAGNRATRQSETWGCGIPSQNGKMEYTASGFSEPILTIFRPVYRTRKTVERTYSDSFESVFKGGTAAIHTFRIFEERVYLPVARFVQRLSGKVSDLHDVDLDTYILYAFGAIVVLILAAGGIAG